MSLEWLVGFVAAWLVVMWFGRLSMRVRGIEQSQQAALNLLRAVALKLDELRGDTLRLEALGVEVRDALQGKPPLTLEEIERRGAALVAMGEKAAREMRRGSTPGGGDAGDETTGSQTSPGSL